MITGLPALVIRLVFTSPIRNFIEHLRYAVVNKYALMAGWALYFLAACRETGKNDFSTWTVYRGGNGSNAYSSLNQINRSNVRNLKPAWTFRTGDPSEYVTLECNPIIVDTVLYAISPKLKAFALHAATGKLLWMFDPFQTHPGGGGYCRGLTYWSSGDDRRVFLFAGSRMLALNAITGQPVAEFGRNGCVDLAEGLRPGGGNAEVEMTSPGIIYKDLIIVGSSVGEDYGSSPGHIRAYDVRSGKMKWIFHTIPQPGEFGYDSWPKDSYRTAGGCNDWSGFSLDKKRGIVFAATGGPAFDFHGGDRTGQNLFGNCVIAIDAATGKRIWHFQTSHHDLWDYDLPAPPNLVTVKHNGKRVDAVAQISKQGFVFLLDRETGVPLFPVQEKPVPASQMPGEHSWPTQPFPEKPLPLCRQGFSESDITDISQAAHDYVLREAKKYTWGDIYLPPSEQGTIEMPGFRGGGEWSGAAFDPETGVLYAGINDIPNIVRLIPKTEKKQDALAGMATAEAGAVLYSSHCAVCHGSDRKGNGSFPPLLNVSARMQPAAALEILKSGKGMMPSFNTLPEVRRNAIVAFLFRLKGTYHEIGEKQESPPADQPKRYALKGYVQLLDSTGYPGVKPPWGTLNAVDLNTGELLWKVPVGGYAALAGKGLPNTGTQLLGGVMATAGGLLFIGASQDEKFRAIDEATGRTLWEYQLPAGGYATPATYEVNGKQYVVIAAGGGGRQRTRSSDYYIAFALP
jgi:quinoprotein glucose dehydrogenase